MTTEKLYLVTRRDLPAGQQAVQAAHAMREFAGLHPKVDQHWHDTSNTLAFLAAEDETELERLKEKARRMGIPLAEFREPDRGNELTAIALSPQAKPLCRRLPLALNVY